MPFPWSPAHIEQMRQMLKDGLSASEIAARLGGGVSRCAIIGKIRRLGLREGIPAVHKPTHGFQRDPRIDALMPRIGEMFRNGYTIKSIAETFGISLLTVRIRVDDLGLKRQAATVKTRAPASKPHRPPAGRARPMHPTPEPAQPQESRSIYLADLEWNECRYSTSDDAEGRHLFCGAIAIPNEPYCATHRAICWIGASPKKARTFVEAAE